MVRRREADLAVRGSTGRDLCDDITLICLDFKNVHILVVILYYSFAWLPLG